MHHPTALLFALLFTGQLFSLKEKGLDYMKLHFCKDVRLSRCPKTPVSDNLTATLYILQRAERHITYIHVNECVNLILDGSSDSKSELLSLELFIWHMKALQVSFCH